MTWRDLRLACLAFVFSVSSYATSAEHTKDSLDQVRMKLRNNQAILIDVREKREWDAGHLRQAKWIPLSKLREQDDLNKLLTELSKEKTIYCHCRSGGRVLPASDILKQLGYDCRPLKHGYADLVKAGFPKAED